ncbi:hypothetical protein BTW00_04880 [Psychrobacter sp. C 20.9]|uniref:restriction endonuclease subunit S n=1 Tax=Psychrobacter sp. C 20.9 TaxID=1926477 RepID=UPI0009472692|nr:restriction endonuclease subunit S [Psychrobacter sp. C 20.9]OLF36929.1 hypothetical protein BTW00_04880 [Psychrobacter sp. C 20.9]
MKYKHFENLPNNWNLDKFENLSKITCGVAATPEYVDENVGVPFFSASNVQKGLLYTKKVKYIPRELHERLTKNTKPAFGDVLMTRVGAGIGETAIVDVKYDFSVYVSLTLIKPNKKLNSNYLKYVLNTDYYRYLAVREQFAGGGVQNLNVQMVKNYLIAVPPLPEQQKIAKILSTWDKAINTTERLIENSTQQKKALMQQLLTGKKRLLDESGKRFEGEWESLTIGDVVELFNGYAFKSSDALEKGYKWLKIANVGIGEIKWDNSSYLPEGYKDEYNRFNLKVGDVVVAMTRPTLGNQLKIARLKNKADESLLNQRVAKLLFSEKVSSEYMYQLLSTIEVALKLNHALLGTDPPNLSTKVLHEISMELPPLIEQQKIATVLTNADKEIELLEQQLADLQQEKKALMQVLLTGKKRVVVDGDNL